MSFSRREWALAHMEEKVHNAPSNCIGGNFNHFLHKEYSGKIPYYTILTKL